MMSILSRRQLLGGTALAVGSFAAGTAVSAFGQTPVSHENPWKYVPVDQQETAKLAYDIFPDGHCMYATFRALVAGVANAQSKINPAAAIAMLDFPFDMMKIGSGGFAGEGSLCGAVAGCSQAIALFVPDKTANTAMVQELFQFYETSLIPSYKPEKDDYPDMASVKSGSPLCHLSVSAWCKESGETTFAPARAERCRRLSADMVIETVKLLNRYHGDAKCTFAPLMEPTKSCVDCHGKGGTAGDTIVKMNCVSCHELPKEHPLSTPIKSK